MAAKTAQCPSFALRTIIDAHTLDETLIIAVIPRVARIMQWDSQKTSRESRNVCCRQGADSCCLGARAVEMRLCRYRRRRAETMFRRK